MTAITRMQPNQQSFASHNGGKPMDIPNIVIEDLTSRKRQSFQEKEYMKPSLQNLSNLKNITKTKHSELEQTVLRRFYSYNNFQFAFVRLSTFEDWPLDFIKAKVLAENGFFFLHKDDLVQCYYCRGVIGHWEEGDKPHVEHKTHYPHCPFVMKISLCNIPHNDEKPNVILEKFISKKMTGSYVPERKNVYQEDSVRVRSMQPNDSNLISRFPEYNEMKARLKTFLDKPSNMPDAEELAKAGLFKVGITDLTHCYVCGGGIFNWKENEDPVSLHKELYPSCPGLPSRSKEEEPSKKKIKLDSFSNEEKEELYKLPLLQKLINPAFGYPKEFVVDALTHNLNKFGTLPKDDTESTDMLMDYEEYLDES